MYQSICASNGNTGCEPMAFAMEDVFEVNDHLNNCDSLEALRHDALRLLENMFTCNVGVFALDPFREHSEGRSRVLFRGMDPAYQGIFFSEFYPRHPFVHWVNSMRTNWKTTATALNDYVNNPEYINSQCYQEIQRPLQMHHNLAITLGNKERPLGIVGLFRPPSRPYDADDRLRARLIAPVLSSKIQQFSADHSLSASRWLLEAIEPMDLSEGILLVDHSCRVIFINGPGRNILNSLSPGSCSNLSDFVEIPRVIKGKLKELDDRTVQDRGIHLTVKVSGAATYVDVTISAVPATITNQGYLIRLMPECKMLSDSDHLRELGLTHREIDVVSHLSLGLKNKEIGNRMCISLYTVQSHLKSIYRKLGVSNRTGVIHQLGGSRRH